MTNGREDRDFRVTTVLVTGYLFIQLLANLTVQKQTPLFGAWAIPVGSLLYALSFTWVDLVNDYLGKKRARFLVLIAIGANAFMILWFEFYIWVPGTPDWEATPGAQDAIASVLGGVWRIYLASLTTVFVVENLDISIFHLLKYRRPNLPRWTRSLLSNAVSAPIDASLFGLLAFAGVLPPELLWSIIITSGAYKMGTALISVPMIYLVKSRRVFLSESRA